MSVEDDANMVPEAGETQPLRAKAEKKLDDGERKHWLEYATGAFALVAAIGSVSAALVGYWQWNVLSGQLSVMRAEQRPWIKAEPVLDGDFQFIEGLGDTFPFHFNLTNVGHAPAFNVQTSAFLYAPKKANEDIRATWKERCELLKNSSKIGSGDGFVLLPGETAPSNKNTLSEPGFWVGDLKEAINASGHGGNLDMRIMGCVVYSIGGEKTYHQTGFNYTLETLDEKLNAWNVGINPYSTIQMRDIHLRSIYSSSDMTY